MHKYKKGDLVQHVGGCVGKYVGEHKGQLSIELPQIGHPGYFQKYWLAKDCQPAPDYSKLVEALEEIVNEADFTAPEKMVWTAKDALAKAKEMEDEN